MGRIALQGTQRLAVSIKSKQTTKEPVAGRKGAQGKRRQSADRLQAPPAGPYSLADRRQRQDTDCRHDLAP